MKQYCEDAVCGDGFKYEIWRRVGINGDYIYFPVCRFTKQGLLGGCLFKCPDELKDVMNLPR
jgi:hypothetical protein